ncbi:MAG: hypothetical protein ABIX01_03580 [Chitinophagaceae bacterium]
MPTKRTIEADHGHFFITFTCRHWLPLIAVIDGYDIMYNWFDFLRKQGHFITGYVIMPNHLHATIAFRKTHKSINKIVGDGKRFMAYTIVERLTNLGRHDLLIELEMAVNPSDKKRGKHHEVWEESFCWKECFGAHFTWQKIQYMHKNPCSGKWMLAQNIIAYQHSSARFYLTGHQAAYSVTHFMHLRNLTL